MGVGGGGGGGRKREREIVSLASTLGHGQLTSMYIVSEATPFEGVACETN